MSVNVIVTIAIFVLLALAVVVLAVILARRGTTPPDHTDTLRDAGRPAESFTENRGSGVNGPGANPGL